jgi:DNA gyrase subunit A
VIRTDAKQVRRAGRQTKGVRLMNLGESASLVAVARNAEASEPEPGGNEGPRT